MLDKNSQIPFPPPKNPKFTFIDLFSGIGGFRLGFQNIGGKCVFSSEWDKFARLTYETNFGETPEGDIQKINLEKIPDHDILLAGFPCQPFSILGIGKKINQGLPHGFEDKKQGNMFFEILKVIEKKIPRIFVLENVKNLKSHNGGDTFTQIRKSLEEVGYSVHWKVLNGKYYVPQNRERIFIIGFDKSVFNEKEEFEFPIPPEFSPRLNSILQKRVADKFTISERFWDYLQMHRSNQKEKGNKFSYKIVERDGVSGTLTASYDGGSCLIPQKNKRHRKLTPRECARLQGFPDSFKIPVSITQSYKQFGNSVVVPLIQEIAEKVYSSLKRFLN